jgi:hypothetical protein
MVPWRGRRRWRRRERAAAAAAARLLPCPRLICCKLGISPSPPHHCTHAGAASLPTHTHTAPFFALRRILARSRRTPPMHSSQCNLHWSQSRAQREPMARDDDVKCTHAIIDRCNYSRMKYEVRNSSQINSLFFRLCAGFIRCRRHGLGLVCGCQCLAACLSPVPAPSRAYLHSIRSAKELDEELLNVRFQPPPSQPPPPSARALGACSDSSGSDRYAAAAVDRYVCSS